MFYEATGLGNSSFSRKRILIVLLSRIREVYPFAQNNSVGTIGSPIVARRISVPRRDTRMRDRPSKAIAAELFAIRYVSRPIQGHAARILLAVSLFMVCFLAANSAEAAPAIQLMTPQSGPVGTLVAIVGSGFGTSQGASTVTFNGKPVTWVSWSATSLQVQVPAGATSGNVVVTVSGKASNTKSFTVTPPPVISSLSPTSGPVGATMTVTGSNFTAGGTQSPQVVV